MGHREKTRSILLAVLLLASLLPFATLPARADGAPTSGYCGVTTVNDGKDVIWTLDGTALTITGTGAMADYDSVGPWGTGVASVVIGSGVTSIGNCAFQNCQGLVSVVIPDSVTSIGAGAFTDCTALKSVFFLHTKSTVTIVAGTFGNTTSLLCADSTKLNPNSEFTIAVPQEVSSWSALYDALNTAAYIKLGDDVTFGEGDGDHKSAELTVPEGKAVLLDLNGYTINRGVSPSNPKNGSALTVNGTLTLIDSVGGGRITGGMAYASSGGGVYVNGGTFTMAGGTISGNHAYGNYSYGGGVCVNGGTFTMTGGTISGNNVQGNGSYGGGVCVYGSSGFNGTFIMTGGNISKNTATRSGKGGGVFVVGSNGAFTMLGGTVSGNTVDDVKNGGGVYFNNRKSTFRVGGAPVVQKNNAGSDPSNVKLYEDGGQPITVAAPLTDGAALWVHDGEDAVVAQAGNGYTLTDADAEKFRSDNGFCVGKLVQEDGKNVVQMVLRPALSNVSVSGSTLTVTVVAPANSTLIAAGYDGNGRLTGVATETFPADGGSILGASRSLTLPKNAARYRVFLVDGSYAPLCPARTP